MGSEMCIRDSFSMIPTASSYFVRWTSTRRRSYLSIHEDSEEACRADGVATTIRGAIICARSLMVMDHHSLSTLTTKEHQVATTRWDQGPVIAAAVTSRVPRFPISHRRRTHIVGRLMYRRLRQTPPETHMQNTNMMAYIRFIV